LVSRLNEALGLSICAMPVGEGAEMADAELLAGLRMHDGAMAGAIV
jgi:hypothetical protein